MLDWEIHERDTLPPEDTDPTPVRRPPRMPRLVVLVVAALLVITAVGLGGWMVRNRLVRNEDAMRADLLTFVRAEEQARRFNNTEGIEGLIAEDAPSAWRTQYESLFVDTQDPVATDITLESVDFQQDGITAVAVVRLGAHTQWRAYRATAQGWRRVPLPLNLWGKIDYLYSDDERIRVRYYEKDHAFATAIMQELPALMETITQVQPQSLSRFWITIETDELKGVILEQGRNRIVLNSPLLVTLPTAANLNANDVVRYEFAYSLLGRVVTPLVNSQALPKHERFAASVRAVLALRWAMPPERYAHVRDQWRDLQRDDWHSPFFSPESRSFSPFYPDAFAAAALLMVDAIYEQHGEAGVVAAFQAMPYAENWDALFMPVTGLNTLQLEAQVHGTTADAVAVSPLPLQGRIGFAEDGRQSVPQLITAEGTRPIELNFLAGTMIQVADAPPLPYSCHTLFSDITVEGTWREAGMRLIVDRMVVDNPSVESLYDVFPASLQSVAFVGIDGFVTPGAISELHALNSDGTSQRLLAPVADVPLLILSLQPSNDFFFITHLEEGCPVQWLIHYDPDVGIIGQWLGIFGDEGLPMVFWDDSIASGIVFLPNARFGTGNPYWQLTPNRLYLSQEASDGNLPMGRVLALREGEQEAVLQVQEPRTGETQLQRVSLDDGRILETYQPPESGFSTSRAYFSADGRYLFAIWTSSDETTQGLPSSLVIRYEVASNEQTTLWTTEHGAIYGGVMDRHQPVLYVLAIANEVGLSVQALQEAEAPQLLETEGTMNVGVCQQGGAYYVSDDPPLGRQVHIVNAEGTAQGDPLPFANGMILGCR